MTIPTTQKECTTRRIASLIIGLWDKVKAAFLLKTSRGAANGVASLDANGKVPSSQLPDKALKPISIYDGYTELNFSNVTFETFCGGVTVENSFSNKLFGGSLDSTEKCIRCLVRLRLSSDIINNLGIGEYPIAVVYMTRQVGSLMLFSNDSNSYAVRMQISPIGSLGSVHRFSPPSAVGSSSQPVFVNSDGSFSPCTNIPAAQVQSDWSQTDNTKKDFIKNKPNLATVATSGSYNDLSGKPTIPAAKTTTNVFIGYPVDTSSAVSKITVSSYEFLNGREYHLSFYLKASIDLSSYTKAYVKLRFYIGATNYDISPWKMTSVILVDNGTAKLNTAILPFNWLGEGILPELYEIENYLHIDFVDVDNDSVVYMASGQYINVVIRGTESY